MSCSHSSSTYACILSYHYRYQEVTAPKECNGKKKTRVQNPSPKLHEGTMMTTLESLDDLNSSDDEADGDGSSSSNASKNNNKH